MFTFEAISKKNTLHTIQELSPNINNVEIRFIIVAKLNSFKLKNGYTIHSFKVSDPTGSIVCNFFDQLGASLCEGDIIYVNGFISKTYRDKLVLQQTKNAKCFILGKYFFSFNPTNDKSQQIENYF